MRAQGAARMHGRRSGLIVHFIVIPLRGPITMMQFA